MPKVRSLVSPTALSSGFQKLGQPVPLSNLVSEENSGRSQPAQAKVPLRCSLSSGLVQGRSVPSWRRISYCSGVSWARHSASVFSISNFSPARAGSEPPNQRRAAKPNSPAAVVNIRRRSIMGVSVRRWVTGATDWISRSYVRRGFNASLSCEVSALPGIGTAGQVGRPRPQRQARTGALRPQPACLGDPDLTDAFLRPHALAMPCQCTGGRRAATDPEIDDMTRDPAADPAGPDQFERREQLPAIVSGEDALRDQLAGHRRGVEPLPAKAVGDP